MEMGLLILFFGREADLFGVGMVPQGLQPGPLLRTQLARLESGLCYKAFESRSQ